MIRCLIYCSIVASDWSNSKLDELIRETRANNDPHQVAQMLVYTNGRFIQLLEGQADAVARAYERIAADPRHHSLTTILSRDAPERLFPELATFSAPETDLAPADAEHPASSQAEINSLSDLIASAAAGAVKSSLRVMPQQPRAIATVDRLLFAVERLVTSSGPNKLTVQDVAIEANVTSQTAYRYFQNTDDLLRVFVSRRQALVLQRIRKNLLHEHFTTQADLANSMVGFMFDALQKKRAVPQAFWHFVLSRHHDVQYEEIWSLADAVLQTMRRCNIQSTLITRVEVAAGLTAAIAAAKGIALHDAAFFRTAACRTLLTGLFQSALAHGAQPA